jgi:OOP family OmpA-OmpF porin
MRNLVVVSAVLCLLGCVKPWPRVEPAEVSPLAPGSGESRVTDHVIVLTDASRSMTAEALLPEARAVTRAFVAGMPDARLREDGSADYDAGLIGFGGGERISADPGPFDRAALADTAAILRPLGSPGYTPLAQVLGEAGDSLSGKRGRAAVVVIGDGRADPPATLAAGQALVSGYPDELCIHTIHTGDSAEGKELFSKLAALSKGGCGSARSAAGLNEATAIASLERDVFLAPALPDVAAAGCGRVVLRGVTFAFDRAELEPESGPVLDIAVERLRECGGMTLAVEGHTDAVGSEDYNLGLSDRRAGAVRQYLVDHGIGADRLTVSGVGEARPVASNDTADGRAQNRRVELRPAQ